MRPLESSNESQINIQLENSVFSSKSEPDHYQIDSL